VPALGFDVRPRGVPAAVEVRDHWSKLRLFGYFPCMRDDSRPRLGWTSPDCKQTLKG